MSRKLGRTEFALPAKIKSEIELRFQQKPLAFFKMPFVRNLITMHRLRSVSVEEMEIADQIDPAAIENVLEYNRECS